MWLATPQLSSWFSSQMTNTRPLSMSILGLYRLRQLYEQKAIPLFIKSIGDDLKKARSKWAAGKDPGEACSFSMFISNFGGLTAVPTDPPYCLMYPNIYSNEVPPEDKNHFNIKGGPPGLHTCTSICHTLLQHADLSEAHRQKYQGSHLVIPQGDQYSHLLPMITMPCNHRALLIDLHSRKPFPMLPVGDFQLVDKIFPGMPRDSLLFNSDDVTKLQKMRFQISTHWKEQLPVTESKEEKPQSSHTSGEAPSSTSKEREPPKSRGKSPQTRHQKCPQTHPAESHHAMANAPFHSRSAMICMNKSHTAPHPGTARTKRVARPCGNMQCLCHRGHLLLNG